MTQQSSSGKILSSSNKNPCEAAKSWHDRAHGAAMYALPDTNMRSKSGAPGNTSRPDALPSRTETMLVFATRQQETSVDSTQAGSPLPFPSRPQDATCIKRVSDSTTCPIYRLASDSALVSCVPRRSRRQRPDPECRLELLQRH